MKYNDFMLKLGSYYGNPQNVNISNAVFKWIMTEFSENLSLDCLLTNIVKKHKYNFGYPDLATIIEIYDKAMQGGEIKTQYKCAGGDEAVLLEFGVPGQPVISLDERNNSTADIKQILGEVLPDAKE